MNNNGKSEKILIMNYKKISYSGEVVAGSLEDTYIVIKPSFISEVCIAFLVSQIEKVVYPNGNVKNFELKNEIIEENISENSIMVRVSGGATFRCELVISPLKVLERSNGMWLAPTTTRGMLFWIPNEEIDEVFGKEES